MKTRAFLMLSLAPVLWACSNDGSQLALQIREPTDRRLFASVDYLELVVARDGRTLGQAQFAATAGFLSIPDVTFGANTVVTLDGFSTKSDIVAHGETCAVDFEAGAQSTSLYFSPTHVFAPTRGAPAAARSRQVAIPLSDGDVLLLGGFENGVATQATTRFSRESGTFVDALDMALATPRAGAQLTEVSSIGWLITGGVGANNVPTATAELFTEQMGLLSSIENVALGARRDHGATAIPNDRVVLTGGISDAGVTLDTTAVVTLQLNGAARVTVGPPLKHARSAHSTVVAVGTPVVIGGFGPNGDPLSSIEALRLVGNGDVGGFVEIAQLQYARADATATLLADGAILIVGGVGATGTLDNAEVYNPITATTNVYTLATPRRGHTATLLPNGHVLVAGGLDPSGKPTTSVELFIPDVGFVSERAMGVAHDGHVAVPLCDGTIIIAGGGADAELYTPSPD